MSVSYESNHSKSFTAISDPDNALDSRTEANKDDTCSNVTQFVHASYLNPLFKNIIWSFVTATKRLGEWRVERESAIIIFFPQHPPVHPGSHSLASQEFECNVQWQCEMIKKKKSIQWCHSFVYLIPYYLYIPFIPVRELDLIVSIISALQLCHCLRHTDHTTASEVRKQK